MGLTVFENSLVVVAGALGTGPGCCCGCCCIDGALDSTRASRQSCEAAGGTWLLPVSVCYVGGVENGDYTNRQDCEYCEPIISTYTCTESTPTGSIDVARNCDSALVAPSESCPPGYTDNGLVDIPGVGQFRSCQFCFPCPEGTEPYVLQNGQQRCGRAADCPDGFTDDPFQSGFCYRVTTVTDCIDCPGSCQPDAPTGNTGPCGSWYTSCTPCPAPPPVFHCYQTTPQLVAGPGQGCTYAAATWEGSEVGYTCPSGFVLRSSAFFRVCEKCTCPPGYDLVDTGISFICEPKTICPTGYTHDTTIGCYKYLGTVDDCLKCSPPNKLCFSINPFP